MEHTHVFEPTIDGQNIKLNAQACTVKSVRKWTEAKSISHGGYFDSTVNNENRCETWVTLDNGIDVKIMNHSLESVPGHRLVFFFEKNVENSVGTFNLSTDRFFRMRSGGEESFHEGFTNLLKIMPITYGRHKDWLNWWGGKYSTDKHFRVQWLLWYWMSLIFGLFLGLFVIDAIWELGTFKSYVAMVFGCVGSILGSAPIAYWLSGTGRRTRQYKEGTQTCEKRFAEIEQAARGFSQQFK